MAQIDMALAESLGVLEKRLNGVYFSSNAGELSSRNRNNPQETACRESILGLRVRPI